MSITKQFFATAQDNTEIFLFKLKNEQGAFVNILTYGGIIQSITVPDKNGNLTDVTIGFDNIDDYITFSGSYFGALVGRYCNRIARGKFQLNGTEYQLDTNDGRNHLHGGYKCFSYRNWNVEECLENDNADQLVLSTTDPHMNGGFPGNVSVTVKYTFGNDNRLRIEYFGKSDEDTILNLTNHAYFNLKGHGNGTIKDHVLYLNANKFTVTDDESIPTGEADVYGVMDFTTPAAIEAGLDENCTDPNILAGKGYDHNYMICPSEENTILHAATVCSEESGIIMDVFTTMPGIQFYSGNYIKDSKGKDNASYSKHSAFCLETQYFPDSPNNPQWPSSVLKKEDEYYHLTDYCFSLI